MEDKDCVPDVSKSSLNKVNRISVISIILIAVISIIIILSIAKILTHKDKLDISKQVFMLSDKSMIYFVDDTNYILSYNLKNKNIKMNGKYKITYDNEINENIKYEYKTYINSFKKEKYNLGFLELQNEELYIDNQKSENGYINTYYILMAYEEKGKLKFTGYNVDTGVKVLFEKVDEKLNNLYIDAMKGDTK